MMKMESLYSYCQKNQYLKYAYRISLDSLRVFSGRSAGNYILCNSVPKSGTHLLLQILSMLPGVYNWGQFCASHRSYNLYPRKESDVRKSLRRYQRDEVVGAHLFFSKEYANLLEQLNCLKFLIYRDPRDVVVSAMHYLKSMNRFHYMHQEYRSHRSMKESLRLSILGGPVRVRGREIMFDSIDESYRRYLGWLKTDGCHCLRYEDYYAKGPDRFVAEVAAAWRNWSRYDGDLDELTKRLCAGLSTGRSHTFRKGGSGGWRSVFDDELVDLFKGVAGDLLIEIGYEKSLDWSADAP